MQAEANSEAREYTTAEVKAKFLAYMWTLIDYWDANKPNKREALEGLAFSILSTIDGDSLELPGFLLLPNPHEDDKEYMQSHGENWFPAPIEGMLELCDISEGSLHELFYAAKPKGITG